MPSGKQRYHTLILGIDQSLVGTGLVAIGDGKIVACHGWTDKVHLQRDNPTLLSWYKAKPGEAERLGRMAFMAKWILQQVDLCASVSGFLYVALEGYALSRLSVRASDLHELGGAVKMGLWDRCLPFRVYDPGSVKLAWTGKGNASKGEMVEACKNLCRLDFSPLGVAGENLADAALIASLLQAELDFKLLGPGSLEPLPPTVEIVLTRETKAHPIPLAVQPFVKKTRAGNLPVISGLEL